MKKLLLALAVCVVTAQPALAQQAFRPSPEQQEQADSQLRNNNREIVGGIIGAIIGGVIAAEILDRDDHRQKAQPRPVVCYAENMRGRVFQEYGRGARRVQWEALAQCEQRSRYHCRPLGCQKVRHQNPRWPNDPRFPHRDSFGGPVVFGRR